MWSLEMTLELEVAIRGRRVMESIMPLVIHIFPVEMGD